MKRLVLFFGVLILALGVQAQKAWIDDVENFAPDKLTKIMVDISKCECQKLVGHPGPLYMWTWSPADPPEGTLPDGTSVGGNGSWGASNPKLEMTRETDVGPDVWSFEMVPTDFYNVSKSKVYSEGFKLLVKALDGGSGGNCDDEFKTEDLEIKVDAPVTGPVILLAMPSNPFDDDVFTIRYDNNLEENPELQNLAEDDALILPSATTVDSAEYRYANIFTSARNYPELTMKYAGDGIFTWTIIPKEFWKGGDQPVPDGSTLRTMKAVIFKKSEIPKRVAEEVNVTIGCP